jgi:hypothetical protein
VGLEHYLKRQDVYVIKVNTLRAGLPDSRGSILGIPNDVEIDTISYTVLKGAFAAGKWLGI